MAPQREWFEKDYYKTLGVSSTATAKEIADVAGTETMGLACHVGQWDAIPAFVDAVTDRFGRIDGLINNAGISPAFVDLVDMTSEYWDKVFSTNLKGPLRLSALIAPVMRDGGGGSIINISSVGGYRGSPRNSHYSASKAALMSLTQAQMRRVTADAARRVSRRRLFLRHERQHASRATGAAD